MMSFSNQELQRYARHFSLSEVGQKGQEKLKNAKIVCVGAGGLGCALLQYLVAAGVGTIGIVDGDRIDITNLHRQILFRTQDIGQLKVEIAKQQLNALNPNTAIQTFPIAVNENNVRDIVADFDVVADCTDNFPARYLINDACFYQRKPLVSACVLQFSGQCSVFCAKEGPCYRCLYPESPPQELIPNCAEAGVLGVLPGLLGTLQALQMLQLLLDIGEPLIGKQLAVDALTNEFHLFSIERNPHCLLCKHHIAFEALPRPTIGCQVPPGVSVRCMTAKELVELLRKKKVFLLDVREPYEYDICQIGGHLIPLKELSARLDEIDPSKIIVVHCKTGTRSERAVALLDAAGFKEVYSLKGGILAWIHEIDPHLTVY